jgi:hypothetical protein
MSTTESERRLAARLKIVDEHVARENQHDLEGIIQTFGTTKLAMKGLASSHPADHGAKDDAVTAYTARMEDKAKPLADLERTCIGSYGIRTQQVRARQC